MADNIAVKVDGVSKTFKLPHEKNSSIKSAIVNFYRRDKNFEKQQVLQDVSFEIQKGEFFGIVGRNGSGKSTLLKLLARIYSPDKGTVTVNGKLTPFIELGVGFNPELTGRENVFLNGALLGFNRKQMEEMYGDIVAFAELERFMDQKLKNYSSGMQVRLAFSVATRAKTDILLIDEVLAVGDQSFQEKCFDYFSLIKKSGKTVIFVTHDMSNVERFCDRVLIVDRKKEVNGLYSVPDAVRIYNQLNHEGVSHKTNKPQDRTKGEVYIKAVNLINESGKRTQTFSVGKPLTVEVEIASKSQKSQPIIVGLAFHDKNGNNLAGPNSSKQSFTTDNKVIRYKLNDLPLNMGEYYMTVALFNDNYTKHYDIIDQGINLFVNSDEVHHGKFVLNGEWTDAAK